MKKILTLLCFSLMSIGLMAQTNGIQIRKTEKEVQHLSKSKKVGKSKFDLTKISGQEKAASKQSHYEWSNGWEFYYNSDISYHGDGRMKSQLLKDELGNVVSRIVYSYDAQNLPKEISTELLQGNDWKPYMSTVIDYNSQGELLRYEDRYWANNEWQILFGQKFEIEYDLVNHTKTTIESNFGGSKYDTTEKRIEYRINNVLTKEETYTFDGYDSFIPIEQYEYLYDNSGIDTGLLKRIWIGNNWQEDLLYCNYEWDNPGKEFLTNNNVYIKIGSDWDLYERETYSRDSYGSFYYLLERYMNGLWIGDMRISSINDIYKSRVSYTYDLYLSGTWMQLFKIEEEYVYDTEGNILEHIYRESDSNGDMQNLYKDEYSDYVLLMGVNTKKSVFLKIYPNPASNYIIISEAKLSGKKYSITNMAGKIIKSDVLNENLTIEINNIEEGIYLLSIGSFQGKFKISR